LRVSKWTSRWAAAATVGLTVAATLPAGLAAAAKPVPAGPTIKLIVAQKKINVPLFGKGKNARVFLDPGVYIAALGSPLQFDVQRASYAKPVRISEVIHLGKGVEDVRPLPAWTIRRFNGLNRFIRYTIKNSQGKIVSSKIMPFCPNAGNPQRTGPDGPANSPFPFGCASDPFQLGMVFGLQKGWATDPIGGGFFFGGQSLKLKLGRYKATIDIISGWRRLLHISPTAATATVDVHVVKPKPGCEIFCDNRRPHRQKALPKLPATRTLKTPSKADLPDLSPLPSYGIRISNRTLGKNKKINTQLDFSATVWVGGNARLDVEGFRHNGSPWMHAFQYFFHNGHVVGRARVGTMGFDVAHNHWHFEQFAQYRLLNASKARVLRSAKVGFCIAPTDAVNLLLPHATWVPSETGLFGACGSQSALWTREEMPVGWGDTYSQFIPGQAFDITKLPNGTYYVEIIANPEKLLFETNMRNDISLRKVIIGGTPGHRTVRVPAVHGIDPEHPR
jgi:hypothetical protein